MPVSGTREELRVLVVAPVGRDADVTCEMLRGAGIVCQSCATVEQLGVELASGAGAILVTSEALGADGAPTLARLLEAQETWSDIPVVIAAAAGDSRARESPWGGIARAGAVTVLERPVRVVTLHTVIQSALRARQRQYEMRELLEQLRIHAQRLDSERVIRERFVSLLAHDLRGPLTAVTMAAKALVDRPELLDARRDLALRIQRSARRIDKMVQDLLDANRLRAGHRLPLRLEPCDLVEIVADVVADLADRERGRVRTSVPDRLEGVWDPDQLRRALWNLLTNALKYGPTEGLVSVQVGGGRDEVEIVVHNTGPGIPPDEQPRIFEPFARAASAAAGSARGWGLGLTLVRGCAEAHGGSLLLSSSDAEGTQFTLRLPVDARRFQANIPEPE